MQTVGVTELITISFLVPGKPPMNITSLALRLSSIAVKWDLPQSNHCGVFPLRGYRVFYALSNIDNATRSHSIDVNSSTDHVVIQHLENFQYYLIWLQTITTRGLGPPSKAMKIRTIEKGELQGQVFFLKKSKDGGSSRFVFL